MAFVGQLYYNVLDTINQPQINEPPQLITTTGLTPEILYEGNIVTDSPLRATQYNKLGVQAPPGTQIVLNEEKTIMVGRTGMYELDDDVVITSMRFVHPKNYTEDAEAIKEAISVSTASMRQLEKNRGTAIDKFFETYGITKLPDEPVEPDKDDYTDPEEYEAAMRKYERDMERYKEIYTAYTEIQNEFFSDPITVETQEGEERTINGYDEALNLYNQGINGIYMIDPDEPYQDLFNVIIDFVYE